MPSLPLDVLEALLHALVSQGLFGTLATITACNQTFCNLGTPKLYQTLYLTNGNASQIFTGLLLPDGDLPHPSLPERAVGALWPDQPLPLPAESIPRARTDPTYPSHISHQRKMHCLSYTKQLIVGAIPSHGLSNQLKMVQRAPGQYAFFPNVQLVHLPPAAYGTLQTGTTHILRPSRLPPTLSRRF